MKGKLKMYRIKKNGKTAIQVRVMGNVGQENRDKLTALGMNPVSDISNCREKVISDPIELGTLRDALIIQKLVEVPNA